MGGRLRYGKWQENSMLRLNDEQCSTSVRNAVRFEGEIKGQ